MDSTDEEDYWDEIAVPLPSLDPTAETIDIPFVEPEPYQPLEHNIEITLTRKGAESRELREQALAKRQAAARDRRIRLESHKLHTVALLASLSIRNKWLNDEILKARLLSLVPLPIQHGFTSIKKSAHPDPARRGRLFEAALTRLVDWFAPSSPFATQNSYVGRPSGWFQITSAGHVKKHTFQAASNRIRILEKREAERRIRRAKREERRAKRAQARIKGKGKARDTSSFGSDEGEDLAASDSEDEWHAPERLRSPNSIAKHALQRSGSRDMVALVFVAIVRALGMPARLVSSLQSVAWTIPKDYSNKKGPQRSNKDVCPDQLPPEDDVELEEVTVPVVSSSKAGIPGGIGANDTVSVATPRGEKSLNYSSDNSTHLKLLAKRTRGVDTNGAGSDIVKRVKLARQPDQSMSGGSSKAKAMDLSNASPSQPTIKLRQARPKGNILGAAPTSALDVNASGDNPSAGGPPTLWAEVYSRPDGRWIPVDPVRGIVNRAGVFEERDKGGRQNADKLMYVVAMEEDGYARDVTARYAKNFGAHQARARARVAMGGKNGKAEWWDGVMRILKRPYALHRDDVEDAELSHQRALEGLPTSIGAFKDHPIYALERHLRRDEAIYPRTEIAHFRGEPVFPRRNVLSLKPADGWMRHGRVLREGMQPLKMVKARASTIRKKRELEMRREEEGEVMVGMYAEWQTELYNPPPVVNGKIPTNDFGNIDLYAPTMLPKGAVHIPHKACAKVARKLGISFAEAVTGFEFRKRQATPIITGIVIAAENEQVFLEALASHTHAEQLKEAAKRRERVLQRWTRLVQGLRIVQRVNEQYSHAGKNHPDIDGDVVEDRMESEEPGGFLDDLRDVVKPYNLPQAQLIVPRLIPDDDEDRGMLEDPKLPTPLPDVSNSRLHGHLSDPLNPGERENENMEPEAITNTVQDSTQSGPPLTMQQLADQLSRARAKANPEQPKVGGDTTHDQTTQHSPENESPQTNILSRSSDGGTQDKINADQTNGEHKEGEVGTIRNLRRSQRPRKAPFTRSNAPAPTRTLRPRRKP